VNGDITRYVYDRADIVTEYDGSWNVKSKYTHNLGIDDPLTVEQAGNAYYYHKHGLGSVTELTDASGNVIKTYRYKSFGEIYSETGTFNQPFTFTGREYDPESRLYYYRARYYDPRAGRFLTQDPIGFASGDVNLYRYVQNNPINWVDALGLWSPAAHDFMFRFSFLGKLSNSDIARLQQASRSFDSRTQSPNLSYMQFFETKRARSRRGY
jgi:RHS repeat-associated protein